jgi:hypothetical protein
MQLLYSYRPAAGEPVGSVAVWHDSTTDVCAHRAGGRTAASEREPPCLAPSIVRCRTAAAGSFIPSCLAQPNKSSIEPSRASLGSCRGSGARSRLAMGHEIDWRLAGETNHASRHGTARHERINHTFACKPAASDGSGLGACPVTVAIWNNALVYSVWCHMPGNWMISGSEASTSSHSAVACGGLVIARCRIGKSSPVQRGRPTVPCVCRP